MPYIPLEDHLPGITGLLEYSKETAAPIHFAVVESGCRMVRLGIDDRRRPPGREVKSVYTGPQGDDGAPLLSQRQRADFGRHVPVLDITSISVSAVDFAAPAVYPVDFLLAHVP